MAETVLRDNKDGLAILTLNRPDKLNSLTVEMFELLAGHVEAIAKESESIGLVLLRGAGKCFSAGNDLAGIAAGVRPSRANLQTHVIEALASLPQPVISAVHGHCYTGGLELALAGDIILASANAKFGDTHSKFGLTPIWGMSQRLPRRVGKAKAMEMMITSRTFSGAEAEKIGLANVCYADDAFEGEVEAFCRSVLGNSWFSHRGNKMLLNATDGMSLEAGLSYEVYNNPGVAPDAQARIAGFGKK